MILHKKILLPAVCFCICTKNFAQANEDIDAMRIAIVMPLYLDSAFTNNVYKLSSNYIPQYILTGLDFYNGAMLAVDSLQKENINAEVFMFDSKNINTNSLLNEIEKDSISLIIASFNNASEQKIFSDFSLKNNVPLISATYPNDAGVNANPYFIMLNSTLQTHVNSIYKYLQQNFSKSKITFITRKGILEDRIKKTFDLANQSHALQYSLLELEDNFSIDDLSALLDSTKNNVVICGSLNESFASNVYQTINNAKIYKTTLIGMPDWDGIKEINKTQSNSKVSVIYTTPFNFFRNDSLINSITENYTNKISGKPSDMVYKGFEATYHFIHLLSLHQHDLVNHLSDKDFSVFDNFSIEPVKLNSASFVPDYLENRNLYFIKKMNGKIVAVSILK